MYKSKTVDVNELFQLSFKSNTEFDKIHALFCKYVLRVQCKACNSNLSYLMDAAGFLY